MFRNAYQYYCIYCLQNDNFSIIFPSFLNSAETSGNLGGSMVDSAFVFPMSLNLYNEFLDLVV